MNFGDFLGKISYQFFSSFSDLFLDILKLTGFEDLHYMPNGSIASASDSISAPQRESRLLLLTVLQVMGLAL
jgi:hypothetical protein